MPSTQSRNDGLAHARPIIIVIMIKPATWFITCCPKIGTPMQIIKIMVPL